MASKTSPLTERDHALWAMNRVSDGLPFRFPNGAELQTVEGYCNACRCRLRGEAFRGRMDATFARVLVIEGLGFCRACNLYTRFLYRVHDDFSFTGIRDGRWVRWLPKRRPIDRLRLWVRQFFSV